MKNLEGSIKKTKTRKFVEDESDDEFGDNEPTPSATQDHDLQI